MYNVEFKIINCPNEEFNGFCNVKTEGFFEPGWHINLLFHDIFEHFFEDSIYFKTQQLSQAGECVALGIREYFDNNSGLVKRFAGYNRYQGCEWNSFTTVLSQVKESSEEEYPQYPNDFNYKTLSKWNKHNRFKGVCKHYDDLYNIPKFHEKIEKAVSYGYWLGNHLFKDKLNLIDDFCNNLKLFLTAAEFPTDMHETHSYYLNSNLKFNINVAKNNITGRFNNGVIIKQDSDINKVINKWIKAIEI